MVRPYLRTIHEAVPGSRVSLGSQLAVNLAFAILHGLTRRPIDDCHCVERRLVRERGNRTGRDREPVAFRRQAEPLDLSSPTFAAGGERNHARREHHNPAHTASYDW